MRGVFSNYLEWWQADVPVPLDEQEVAAAYFVHHFRAQQF